MDISVSPTEFIPEIREHYLDQFRAFVRTQTQLCAQGAAEVKFDLGEECDLFRQMYCIDFVRNDGEVDLIELRPDRILTFNPITGTTGKAEWVIERLEWDDVVIYHDLESDLDDALTPWFEKWFDPDDRRYVEGAELGNVIHSLGARGKTIRIDFGTADADAFWELLHVLGDAGASELRISGSRAEAEAS